MTTTILPARAEVPLEQTWDKTSVFATHADWEAELHACEAALPTLDTFAGTLAHSPQQLVAWLEVFSALRRRTHKVYFYAMMSSRVDALDTTAKEMLGPVTSLISAFDTRTAFMKPELLALGAAPLRAWIEAEPRLAVYRHLIEDVLRQQPHVRSAEVEALLGMLGDPFDMIERIYSELTNTDMAFAPAHDSSGQPFPVSQSTISAALESPDRTLRQTAWEQYADAYLQVQNSLAQTYIASVRQNIFEARARQYESVLAMRLHPFNLPLTVFHQLIATYQANLKTWHRYWEVKRRALRLPTLHPYDVWAPIVPDATEVPFEQAVEWISAGMQPLGSAYVEVLRRGCLQERWVDYAINQGKRQGAFSYGTVDTRPFIMMSYSGSLKSLSTLAHELGHSMHSYLTDHTQPEVYSHYSMFVAEVASNFNQALTRAHLFQAKQGDRAFQIALIEEAMSNFHRYFFIMPTLARFELEVHTRAEQGKPLTADILNGILGDYFAEGYGSTMTDDPRRTGITWAQFQHLYVPFYTFQYATGISAAHALAADILAGKPQAAERYVQFLSLGGSQYPLEALKLAGVDMTTPAAIEQTFATLSDYVDRLEALTQ